MIELTEWIRTTSFPSKPWLMLGKGPTFASRQQFDLSQFNLFSLNHVVRELNVSVAHMIDIDVAEACGEAILRNAEWLVIPRRPHVNFDPGPLLLEDFVRHRPILQEIDRRGRLVWYNLSSGRPVGASPVIRVRYFSSEAALNILAKMGVRTVRSLGVDGGRSYSPAFRDLDGKTRLANGQPTFDLQFAEMEKIVKENKMDYSPLVEPMRVFVGTDESQMVATRVLEYSIKKHASRPVELTPMLNFPVPTPRDKDNRPRTGFSFARFLIPKLCGYKGRALYVDADMQVFGDLGELWNISFGDHKVLCTNQTEAPAAWKDSKFFHLGRQMSVMMIDCSRVDWEINDIIERMDKGEFGYQNLMFELCVVKPHEVADGLPPEWNHLEHYKHGVTKLLHYTVVPTQPWKNDENPLCDVWEGCYREAVEAGAVPKEEVESGIRNKHLKLSLAECLSSAPSRRAKVPKPSPLAVAPAVAHERQLREVVFQNSLTTLKAAVDNVSIAVGVADEKQRCEVSAAHIRAVLSKISEQQARLDDRARRLQGLKALERELAEATRSIQQLTTVVTVLERRHYGGLPLPPERQRLNVGTRITAANLWAQGLNSAERVLRIFGDTPRQPVLDWGCGCGRTLRWLHCFPAWRMQYYGCDVDAEAIEWLSQVGKFKVTVCQDAPPLPYSDRAFGGLFAFSVLTHIHPDHHRDWYVELQRVLEPGGLAYLTTQGSSIVENPALEIPAPIKKEFAARGFAFLEKDGHYKDAALVSEAFTRRTLDGLFAVEQYEPGGYQGMDSFLVRRLESVV